MRTIQVGNISIGDGHVKICVPLLAETKGELLSEAQEVTSVQPDLIEWRIDYYNEAQDIANVLETLAVLKEIIGEIPLIFSCRVDKEGGHRSIPNEARFQLMNAVMKAKLIDILDIELITEKKDLELIQACAKNNGVYTIISKHYFDETPTVQSMVECLLSIQEQGADIAKLAVMPASPADVLDLLKAAYTFKEEYANVPFIAISMSKVGLISRVTGDVFGSSVTFASGRKASAPGQIEVSKLRQASEIFP